MNWIKENWFVLIPAIMLLLAIPDIWPYDYFVILRWVVAGFALYVAYNAHEMNRSGWMWIMGVIAILFNPIIPVHLTKEAWVVLDFISAFVFLLTTKVRIDDAKQA